MSDKKKYVIGDFEYSINVYGAYIESYIGPLGPDSVATKPDLVIIEGRERKVQGFITTFVNGIPAVCPTLETLLDEAEYSRIEYMPLLKKLILTNKRPNSSQIAKCPALSHIVIKNRIKYPVNFLDTPNSVRIGIHAVFGDNVEVVGTINGGHITLGKSVKKINAIKKADFGLSADTTVDEYRLPTRIDFLSPTPPDVGTVAPGSISATELHVPVGTLDIYMSHPQWGKAAYFVDADGNTVDKYAKKHKTRHENKSKKAKSGTKKEKNGILSAVLKHAELGKQLLAKWDVELLNEIGPTTIGIHFSANLSGLTVEFIVKGDHPVSIWDKIVAEFEYMENKLNYRQ